MNFAYLTTVYPSVSHTFIRREILELERRGHTVHRFSIRHPDSCVDATDHREKEKTFYCLSQPKHKIFWNSFEAFIRNPKKWTNVFFTVLRFSKLSERGLLTHLAYLAEACVLAKELQRRNVNHIHTHFGTNPTMVAFIVKQLSGVSYSFTAHGPDEFDAPIGLNLKEKIHHAEFVVAISNYGAAQLKRWAILNDWKKIIVVGCTVDDEFASGEISPQTSRNQIVCVARLSAQKGIFILLDALARMKQNNLDMNLVLAGDGELRDDIESYVQQSGLAENVTITGWIDGKEVRKHILESRALVMSSFAEGLPVVLMEAFILKKPVLSTWIAGIPELVRHKENGWLFEPNSVEALVFALTELVNTEDLRLNEMGQKGYEDVLKTHTVLSEVPKLEEALSKVTGN